jgi:protein-disulfide isomerase
MCIYNTSVAITLALILSAGASAQRPATADQLSQVIEELRQIRLLLEKKDAERETSERTVEFVIKDAERLGAPDAPVTVVEFLDFGCSFCRQFVDLTFADLKKRYIDTGIVRFYVQDLPLAEREGASIAASAGRCARDQGAFWDIFEKLHRGPSHLTFPDFVEIARETGLDVESFQGCLKNGRRAEIEASVSAAMSLGVQGTPTFIIGQSTHDGVSGEMVLGAMPLRVFEEKIERILSAASADERGRE